VAQTCAVQTAADTMAWLLQLNSTLHVFYDHILRRKKHSDTASNTKF